MLHSLDCSAGPLLAFRVERRVFILYHTYAAVARKILNPHALPYFLAVIGLALDTSGQALPSAPPPAQRPELGPNDRVSIQADEQDKEGAQNHAIGDVRLYTGTAWIQSDKASHNTETDQVHVEGNVFFQNLEDGQKLSCDIADYDLNTKTGTFYNVAGSASARINTKPGMLTTADPFYFKGEKAEKIDKRYIVHNGYITDCKPTNMWWNLHAKTFDIIPDDRAIANNATTLFEKRVPIFYFSKVL